MVLAMRNFWSDMRYNRPGYSTPLLSSKQYHCCYHKHLLPFATHTDTVADINKVKTLNMSQFVCFLPICYWTQRDPYVFLMLLPDPRLQDRTAHCFLVSCFRVCVWCIAASFIY